MTRVAAIALVALAADAACTKDNPSFCTSDRECGTGKSCDVAAHRCVARDAGTDAARDVARDLAPPDLAADQGPDLEADAPADATIDRVADHTPDNAPDLPPPDVAGSCGLDQHCPPALSRCVANRCVECGGEPHCPTARPGCLANRCVECTRPEHCGDPLNPICGAANTCLPCATDTQCVMRFGANPGICLAHLGGRCATDAETIHVQDRIGCSTTPGGGGSSNTPYCQPQLGIDAVTATKRVVVVRGPRKLAPWTYLGSGPAVVSIVGKDDAQVVPYFASVRIGGGEMYIRDLKIAEGQQTAVLAENGAVLRMNRCIVEMNLEGGIYANGAGFDISNTVVASNEGQNVSFGGVYLLGPDGKPRRFVNNTVVNNKKYGVYCAAMHPVRNLLVAGNGVDVANCVDSGGSRIGVVPRFDTTNPQRRYRLVPGAPCHDQGEPTDAPVDDIDGESRPRGVRFDCGADELAE